MTDFERNSSNNNSKEQLKHDPLLELTRLFGGKPEDEISDDADYAGYQAVDYPVSEGSLPAYPSWDETRPAGHEPAFFENMEQEYYGDDSAEGEVGTDTPYQPLNSREEETAYYPHPMSGNDTYHTAASELLDYENRAVNEREQQYISTAGRYEAAYPYADVSDENHIGHEELQGDMAGWSPLWAEDVAQPLSRTPADQPPVSIHDNVRVQQAFNPAEMQESAISPLPDPSFPQDAWEEEWPQHEMVEETAPFYDNNFSSEIPADPLVPTLLHEGRKAGGGISSEISDEMYSAAEAQQVYGLEKPVGEITEAKQDPAYPFDEQVTAQTAFSPYQGEGSRFPAQQEIPAQMQPKNGRKPQQAAGVYSQAYGPIRHNYAVQGDLPEQDNLPGQENATFRHEGIPGQQSCNGTFYPVGEETGREIPNQNFAETLHDFDLTIQSGRSGSAMPEQKLHEPEVNTVGVEGNRIEYTGTFDLPPVDYENGATQAQTQASLEQEFADIFENTKLSATSPAAPENFQDTHDASFYAQRPSALENPDFSEEENEKAGSAYDWGAPAAIAAAAAPYVAEDTQQGSGKWGYRFAILTVLAAFGTGAYFYLWPKNAGNDAPVIIHAEREAVRVMPENPSKDAQTTPAPAVYNRVEGNIPAKANQEKLIDETETPMNMRAIEGSVSSEVGDSIFPAADEQPPQSTESGLDQTSVADMVMAAAAKSLPIHVVPTVRVQQGQTTIPVPATGEKAVVLIPGKSMQKQSKDTVSANAAAVRNLPLATEEKRTVEKPAEREAAASEILQQIVPPSVIPAKPEIFAQTDAVDINPAPVMEKTPVATAEAFYVQIVSAKTQEEAQKAAEDARRRLGPMLDQNRIVIMPAVIPGKGSFYRVRIMTTGHEVATNLCTQYKQISGLDCFVGR